MDTEEYIDELKERIKYIENMNDSLRKEIRKQRKEIAVLKKECKPILNKDSLSNYDSL